MKNIIFIFFGIIAAAGAIITELALSTLLLPDKTFQPGFFDHLSLLLLCFAFIEEFFKFAMIRQTTSDTKKPQDFFKQAFLIGLGFSATEFYLAFSQNVFIQTNILPSLAGIALIHLSTSLLFGYSFFIKKHLPLMTLGLAIILHIGYNSLLIYNFNNLAVYTYLAGLFSLIFYVFLKLARSKNLA